MFIFLCDVLHLTRGSVHADELAAAIASPKLLAALLKCLDDPASGAGAATLALLQRLHAVPSLTPRLRATLATAANAPGVPRGALRVAHARLDDAERGLAPHPPRLETHPAFSAPSAAATPRAAPASGERERDQTPPGDPPSGTYAGLSTLTGARLSLPPAGSAADAEVSPPRSQLPPPPKAAAPRTPHHPQPPPPAAPEPPLSAGREAEVRGLAPVPRGGRKSLHGTGLGEAQVQPRQQTTPLEGPAA